MAEACPVEGRAHPSLCEGKAGSKPVAKRPALHELLRWGASEGYAALDLGMAPLAGIDAHRRAPLASKLSALVYEYGERLYGFEGLRAYKNKFQPRWEPVFLCLENRQAAPLALSAAAWLTQRGLAGLIKPLKRPTVVPATAPLNAGVPG